MASIKEQLLGAYREACKGFSRFGRPQETLECAALALRMKPNDGEILGYVSAAVSPPAELPAPDLEAMNTLLRWKAKLDGIFAVELSVAEVRPEWIARPKERAAEPASPTERDYGKLRLTFANLKKRLKRERDAKTHDILQRLIRLAEDCARKSPNTPEEQEKANEVERPDLPNDDYGELSIEHELHNCGNDMYKLGMFDEAIEAYNLALEVRPDLLETYFNRGFAYTRLGNYLKALEDLNKVIELNPNLAEAFYTRGLVREYQTEYKKAIEEYDQALKVDPKYTKAITQREIAEEKLRNISNPPQGRGSSSSSSSESEGIIRDWKTFLKKPQCSFADVGGCNEAVRALRRVMRHLNDHEAVRRWGGICPVGLILYGPPGCGKTTLAYALAGELSRPFFDLPPAICQDMWSGNTEKNMRALFEAARAAAPCIVNVNEIESMFASRAKTGEGESYNRRAIGTLLHEMDRLSKDRMRVLVIGTTNAMHFMDKAFLRPGRFYPAIRVPRPDVSALLRILAIHLSAAALRAQRVDFLDPSLRQVVMQSQAPADMSAARNGSGGLVRVARAAYARQMSGADIFQVVNTLIEDRIEADAENIGDPGPITATDVLREISAFEHIEPESESENERAA